MKKIKTTLLAMVVAVAFMSCNKSEKFYEDAESFGRLKKELIEKFGKDTYYTSFSVMNSDDDAVISVTETSDPSSLKMAEWMKINSSWKQNSEVTLEISDGSKPQDFMFKLDKIMNIDLLGKVIEQAKQKVITEKKIKEVRVTIIALNAPDNGDFKTTKYFITIEPKQGGTRFNFWYNLDGTLDRFDY